jgi:hypothetical protein
MMRGHARRQAARRPIATCLFGLMRVNLNGGYGRPCHAAASLRGEMLRDAIASLTLGGVASRIGRAAPRMPSTHHPERDRCSPRPRKQHPPKRSRARSEMQLPVNSHLGWPLCHEHQSAYKFALRPNNRKIRKSQACVIAWRIAKYHATDVQVVQPVERNEELFAVRIGPGLP